MRTILTVASSLCFLVTPLAAQDAEHPVVTVEIPKMELPGGLEPATTAAEGAAVG